MRTIFIVFIKKTCESYDLHLTESENILCTFMSVFSYRRCLPELKNPHFIHASWLFEDLRMFAEKSPEKYLEKNPYKYQDFLGGIFV